jgi:hypothetical protein
METRRQARGRLAGWNEQCTREADKRKWNPISQTEVLTEPEVLRSRDLETGTSRSRNGKTEIGKGEPKYVNGEAHTTDDDHE